jgi:hypothetical protein
MTPWEFFFHRLNHVRKYGLRDYQDDKADVIMKYLGKKLIE